LTSSQSAASAQTALDDLVELALLAPACEPRRQRDVVVDRQRQADRQREHDPDVAAQRVVVPDVAHLAARELHRALDAHARHEVVHAIQRAQERGLARVGRDR
jgi:hypothetical protein